VSALRQGRFTATRMLQSTHHSPCRLIFDNRWYLASMRGSGAIKTGLARCSSGGPRKQQVFPREQGNEWSSDLLLRLEGERAEFLLHLEHRPPGRRLRVHGRTVPPLRSWSGVPNRGFRPAPSGWSKPLADEGLLRCWQLPCAEVPASMEFSEVRESDQSALIGSSVCTPQCAEGLRSEGRRVYSSPVVPFDNCAWVRCYAPDRFVPKRSAFLRSAPERSALRRRGHRMF
jgi:hypothetical protein